METVSTNITRRLGDLRELMRELLFEHSADVHDVLSPDDQFVFLGPHFAFGDLDLEGRRLQARLLSDYDRLRPLVRLLLRPLPADSESRLDHAEQTLTTLIDQSGMIWHKSRQEAFAAASEAIDLLIELVSHLYDRESATMIYVPDTNALLWHPDLERWEFSDAPTFTLILTTTVVSELDHLKVAGRTPELREKAEGLIRRIKSYRSRGQLNVGVTLRKGRSTIQALPVEPMVVETLPWLDPQNADDRIVASLIEVMGAHPRTAVVLVTRDLNLQTKAEYAGLPFCEPPDPS